MMLFKLSLKNIKRSIKDYAIYFFTLVLGVAIFYVFNAIDSQTVMLDITSSTYEIIKLMTNILSGVSVFVSFILGFLIIYASRFLIKRRNKEFGIYLTLGMGKRKISSILLLETLFIGLISLFIGLGLGIILSQLMSMLVANMFDADMTRFTFIFSSSACFKTLFYFGIIYIFVMIFNTYNISRCKLIDLLQASKKSEQIKLKNPLLCTIIFLISCCILGYAYYLVTGGIYKLTNFNFIFIPIALGCISTFFLFWSLSGLILRIVMSIKSFYYKGLNSFILREFSSRINTTVFSITIICLMLFVTICVLSSSLSLKHSVMASIDELAPADIMLSSKIDPSNKETVAEILSNLDFDTNKYFKESVNINFYRTPNLTLEDTLKSNIESIKKDYPFLIYSSEENIIKLSEYNKIATLYGNDTYKLNADEYLIIADFESLVKTRNSALKNNPILTIFNHDLKPKYSECQPGFVELSSNHINSGLIIVPDQIVDESYLKENFLIGNYLANNKEERKKIEEKITSLTKHPDFSKYQIDGTSKLSIIEASTGLGALVTFIGIYLGIIFLISSAAILALKELSESSDNKNRFKILRSLGTDEKIINKALFNEIAIFFITPLLLAIIHAIFGIKFCTFILESFGTNGLLPSIIMTTIFLIIIYGGYFLITYFSSKNIIKERI
jgi:putative ABC transport system permease protein